MRDIIENKEGYTVNNSYSSPGSTEYNDNASLVSTSVHKKN